MKKTKEQKGITLIALIITIVVLMILAAVAINSITNDGIISKAEGVADKYTAAQEIEKIRLTFQEHMLQNYLSSENKLTLKEMIESQGWATVEDRENYLVADLKAIIVTMKDSNRTYRVLSNGNIAPIDISWYNDSNATFTLTTPAQLVGFEHLVHEGSVCRNEIKLGNDIDLSGIEWIPIGTRAGYDDYDMSTYRAFEGDFDGDGHIISNLNTRSYEADGTAGLFGTLNGATIRNLTLKNVQVKSTHNAGAIVGFISRYVLVSTIDNCHVDGATITSSPMLLADGEWDNGDKIGGIAGHLVKNSVIQGCSVKNTILTAYRDIGGIVGYASGTVERCVVGENVNIIVDNSHNYKNYSTNEAYNVNHIVGRNDSAKTNGNSGTATIKLPN